MSNGERFGLTEKAARIFDKANEIASAEGKDFRAMEQPEWIEFIDRACDALGYRRISEELPV